MRTTATHTRRRRRLVLSFVVVIGMSAAGCSSNGDARTTTSMHIRNPNHDSCLADTAPHVACAGEGMAGVPRGIPYVYLGYQLCVTGGSSAITAVDLYHPRGSIQVVDWAVRARAVGDPYSSSLVSDAVPGRALDLSGFTHESVRSPCAAKDQFTEFAVSVKIGSQTSVANGIQIRYQSDGKSGTVFEPFSISECTGRPCHIMADRK